MPIDALHYRRVQCWVANVIAVRYKSPSSLLDFPKHTSTDQYNIVVLSDVSWLHLVALLPAYRACRYLSFDGVRVSVAQYVAGRKHGKIAIKDGARYLLRTFDLGYHKKELDHVGLLTIATLYFKGT